MVLALYMSAYFLFTGKGNKKANKLLSLYLFIFLLLIINSFTTSNWNYQHFYAYHKPIFIFEMCGLVTGPLLLFYVRSIFLQATKKKGYSILHFFPFLGFLGYVLIVTFQKNNFVIWETYEHFVLCSSIVVLNFIYIVASITTFVSNRKKYVKTANSNKKPKFLGIYYLLIGFIAFWIVNLYTFAVIMILQKPGWCSFTNSLYALIGFIVLSLYWFVLSLTSGFNTSLHKYPHKYTLTSDEKKKYQYLLNNYMSEFKPYLDPELSLKSLSEQTMIKERILSHLINDSYDYNFKGYINKFRIDECINMLSDSKHSDKTIQEIMYLTGFNSNSVFYQVFKSQIGITPQTFRKKVNQFENVIN